MSSIKITMPPNTDEFFKAEDLMELGETRKLFLEKLCRPQGVSLHCGRSDLENVLVIDVILSEYYKDDTCIEYAPKENDNWVRLENCPTEFASTKYRKIHRA